MSKKFPKFSEDEPASPKGSAEAKRTVRPRTKTTTSVARTKKSAQAEPKASEVVKAPVAEAKLAIVEKEAPMMSEKEWVEAAPESITSVASGREGGGNKRKRRRRKGKGGGASSAPVEAAEVSAVTPASPLVVNQPSAKSRIDPEFLAKAAWKIYLAEVSEEGVALVGDQDARELARRCFRLAEIFLEEKGRR